MKQQNAASYRNAFSLVELSIVLVILGLLVGGVLSGQSLIRAAELRSVSTEYQRYTTAVGAFRDKYFAIPGDMSNATSFWTANGNGDGDGNIELTTTAAAADPATNEVSTFWRDLASAALVEGSYTYTAATSATVCSAMTAGTNNPRAKLNNAGWNAISLGNVTDAGSAVFFGGTYGNVLLFNAGTACGTNTATTAVLKPEEVWNIDTKLDDGKPALGTITSLESQGLAAGTACSDLSTAVTSLAASNYSLTNTSTSCSLVFKTGY